jgi:CheY-like chemotaxis protein
MGRPQMAEQTTAQSPRVLVIDDNEPVAKSMKYILDRAGFSVAVATSGPAGLSAFQEHSPHLVLCDIEMPGMKGTEVVRALRSNPETAATPIIVVTGSEHIAAQAGADAVVTKPFDNEQLISLVRSMIELTK